MFTQRLNWKSAALLFIVILASGTWIGCVPPEEPEVDELAEVDAPTKEEAVMLEYHRQEIDGLCQMMELVSDELQNAEEEVARLEQEYLEFQNQSTREMMGEDSLVVRQERLSHLMTQMTQIDDVYIQKKSRLTNLRENVANREGLTDVEYRIIFADEITALTQADRESTDKNTDFEQELSILQQELETLLTLHGAEHPDVLSKRDQIVALQESRNGIEEAPSNNQESEILLEELLENPSDLVDVSIRKLELELDELDRQKNDLEELIESETQFAHDMLLEELQGEPLRHELEHAKEVRSLLLRKLDELPQKIEELREEYYIID